MAWSPRRTAHELLSTLHLLAFIFMAWKALSWASNSPAPIVVVTSESMEPGFQRGDVLFLWNRQRYVEVGDIAVVSFPTRKLPMVHRVIRIHFISNRGSGASDGLVQYLLTKGDNNEANDALLYPTDKGLASRENVIGLVRGYLPFIGWPIIKINELLSRPTRYIT